MLVEDTHATLYSKAFSTHLSLSMKASSTAIVAAALLSVVAARVAPSDHRRHELRGERFHDSPWTKRSRIEGAVLVPVRVGLTQSNLEKGEAMLMDISYPDSARYGQHLSASEINDLFAPSQESIGSVTAWLTSALSDRLITLSRSRQWLQLNATIVELENLLHADYHEYEHRSTGTAALGCDEYHVPEHIRHHIDFITPGVTFLEIRKRAGNAVRSSGLFRPKLTSMPLDLATKTPDSLVNCSSIVTPACVRAIYNVADKPQGNPKNSIGIYTSLGEFYDQDGLNSFFANFAPEIPQGTTPRFEGIDGAPTPPSEPYAVTEGALDFQAAYPLIYPDTAVNYVVNDWFYEQGGDGVTGLFNTFLDALDKSYCSASAFGEMGDLAGVDPTYPDTTPGGYDQPEQCGVYAPTNVISISYAEDELALPLSYQRRQCGEWMKLGLQGVTVVVASADEGVSGNDFGSCVGGVFRAVTPAACPFVRAAGATNFSTGCEQAARLSGGGFSNIFGTPSYQADAVDTYFQKHPPPYEFYNITLNATHTTGVYNRGGRGYPDVAAIGMDFVIWVNGQGPVLTDGTSVATPLIAGMITRINAFRLNAGKKPVGFINPTLYQHPEAFNDITVGSNFGCSPTTVGFSAVEGWDPVSGLGSPNYSKLKDVFMNLP
jgi:tripeptidyl-peptidase-1